MSTVTLVGMDRFLTDAKRVQVALRNPAPMMRKISVALHGNTMNRFARGVDPRENPWIPSRRAQRQGGQTLRDTGRLMNSIRPGSSAKHAEISTELIYAAPHQTGARVGRNRAVKLPVRQFIGFSDKDEKAIQDIVDDDIAGTFR